MYNGNISVVYSPSSHVSTYLTYNKAQYVLPTANDGAIATWGEDPTWQLRQNTLLEELGVKFDLLDKALFISSAIFKQERTITTGVGGLAHTLAHIKGAEIELNYQPDPHFFATASYSYLHTDARYARGLLQFSGAAGDNYDGAGISAASPFLPNQTFQDPGVPQHLFNVLANYKHRIRLRCSGEHSGHGTRRNHPIRLSRRARQPQAGYPGLPPSLVGVPTRPAAGTTNRPRFPGSTP